MPSFYVPHLRSDDEMIIITGEEFHHLAHVFRHKNGDEILLTNGSGLLATACIKEMGKKEISAGILKILKLNYSQPPFAAAFPLLKNKHDHLIIEKLTELGVKEFFPIITSRSVRTPSANTIEKFEKTAIAAIKQCDNAFLPKIHQVQTLPELLENIKNYQFLAALEMGKHKSLFELATEFPDQPLCLIIGPEGGFDEAEIEIFQSAEIPTFTLGNHILRAETAAIAAAAQLLSFRLLQNPEYY